MAWLAMNPGERAPRGTAWYEASMPWISLVAGGAMSTRAIVLLVWPRTASLALDADAFEIGRVFRRVRCSWSGVGGFSVDRTGARGLTVMYEVLDVGTGSGRKATKHFPSNYGMRREELAWLMNAWRERSLALPRS